MADLQETGTLTNAQVQQLWLAAGGSGSNALLAANIAGCESGYSTSVIDNTAYPNRPGYHEPGPNASPEYSVGLWQVNLVAHPQYTEAEMVNGLQNARAIIAITSNGRYFAQTNVNCYRDVASKGEQLSTAPGTPDAKVTGTHALTNAWARFMRSLAHQGPADYRRIHAARSRVNKAVR